eukprot:CAMPEP_0176431042 /NCGR_PEP_ID=MMETSP0127-20121128/14593_1 /TAXON_ID=938130 /ORGANISM="Platyophrya macrostoma, Strain WH" /LENGTH=457 /DNA_ID=CAMNT_0017813007 /DNA_START=32 /DNA_END=1405 /DNA_ORIENTATION=+
MEGNKDPNPERFKGDFIELEDGTGFRIDGCEFVFRYDAHDGWFDEFGNYYDKDGVPTTAPEGSTRPTRPNPEETKADDKKPNPDRFKDFILFEDKAAFAINSSDQVYWFDKDGGWFDEYENYYNHLGEPTTPPADIDDEEDDEEDDYDDDEDEYEPEVQNMLDEYDWDDDDDYEKPDKRVQNQVVLESEYENLVNHSKIQAYPDDQFIKINITNISFKGYMDDFKKLIQGTGAEIERFDYDRYGRNSHQGSARVLVRNKKSAENVISLNGTNFVGRRVIINVVEFENLSQSEEEADEEIESPANNKEDPNAFGESEEVQLLISGINYKVSMDVFRRDLEDNIEGKVSDFKYKKYKGDSHQGEALVTVKGKTLIDRVFKLNKMPYYGRKITVILYGKVSDKPKVEESKASEKNPEKKEPPKTEQKAPEKKPEPKEPQKTQTQQPEKKPLTLKNDSFFG